MKVVRGKPPNICRRVSQAEGTARAKSQRLRVDHTYEGPPEVHGAGRDTGEL